MDSFRTEFPLETGLMYLNHAAVAPWPLRTKRAITLFAEENTHLGATHYPKWLEVEKTLRGQLRTLINATSTDEIALQKNTSEGLSAIAYGIHWQAGDNVVISDQEFPSNRIVWESLASKGVSVNTAQLDAVDPVTCIIDACTDSTKLISISSVQYGTGLKIDLKRLGAFCQERSILFCVDAIQSLGAHAIDVQEINCDFVVADAHKWMLGPEGIALLYVKKQTLDSLSLHQYGWHMIEKQGDYDTLSWDIAKSARRFECGSPNMLGIHGFSASLTLLLEIGIPEVEKMLNEKVEQLITLLSAKPGIRILSPTAAHLRAGIVTFVSDNIDSATLHKQLMKKNVICAYRGGGVRFSPHFYTPEEVLVNAVNLIP
ncbi:class V aminotransferase [Gammaproteobacteria bacterium 45_16_T64]|nr:class V aminotransferase [Gammaproteobacteria bacterium 45_16_T64]